MKLPENLPRFDAVPREEALRLLCAHEYGFPPAQPEAVDFREVEADDTFCAGKAVLHRIEADVHQNGKAFTFPFYFVCISMRPTADFTSVVLSC